MIKRMILVGAMLLAALGTTVSLAGSASADTINYSWVNTSAYAHSGGATYTGWVQALTGDHCVNVQRKTSTGSWVTSGFYVGTTGTAVWDPVRHCADDALHPNGETWNIQNGGAIYGLRVVENTGNIATFCSTKASCQAV